MVLDSAGNVYVADEDGTVTAYQRSGLSKDKAQLSALVEFALGDLNNQVFVSRYAVELPRKEEMARFITQISQEEGA